MDDVDDFQVFSRTGGASEPLSTPPTVGTVIPAFRGVPETSMDEIRQRWQDLAPDERTEAAKRELEQEMRRRAEAARFGGVLAPKAGEELEWTEEGPETASLREYDENTDMIFYESFRDLVPTSNWSALRDENGRISDAVRGRKGRGKVLDIFRNLTETAPERYRLLRPFVFPQLTEGFVVVLPSTESETGNLPITGRYTGVTVPRMMRQDNLAWFFSPNIMENSFRGKVLRLAADIIVDSAPASPLSIRQSEKELNRLRARKRFLWKNLRTRYRFNGEQFVPA